MRRRSIRGVLGAAVLITSMMVAGCGTTTSNTTSNSQASSAPQALTIGVSGDALNLDPQTTADLTSANVFMNIFDNLVTIDQTGKIVPMLATSWSTQGNNWIFNLRQGVKFSNGDPFNATVVKESFDRLLNPATAAPRASLFKAIKEVKVLGSYKVEFVLKYPFAPFLANLTNYAGGIVDPKIAQSEGKQYGRKPVGTGPFELSSWQPGNKIVLKPNPYYWGAKPKLSEVTYLVVPSDATRLSLLKNNQIQAAMQVPPSQIASLQNTPGLKVNSQPGFALEYIGFNDQSGPFKNVQVRQALTYATDRASIIKNIYFNSVSLATGPMPSTVWGSDSNLPQYNYDPTKAKQLLAQAGYPNGFSTTVYVPTSDQTWMQVAQALQSEWAQVGVKVTIQSLDWGTFLQYTAKGKTPVFIIAWSDMTGDGDYNQYYLWDSHSFGVGGNRDFYSNPQVDKLVEAARKEMNPTKRMADYAAAQKIEAQDAPAIFLAFDKNILAESTKVHGIFQSPNSVLYLKSAYIG